MAVGHVPARARIMGRDWPGTKSLRAWRSGPVSRRINNLVSGGARGFRRATPSPPPEAKMKTILSSETMDIPDGVTIKVNAKVIEVEGPRGKLTRNFKHLNLDFQLIKDEETGKRKLRIEAWFGTRKTSAAIRTALSHVENLITGVTKGYRYKMRFVYAHFPINASIQNSNKSIEIRNFLGEKKVEMLEGVSVVRSEKVKDELVVDGNDIELVSRSCALINQKCHVKNKDIRKFLDGIYVSEKGTILTEE
ncbi:hypothetical protein EUGRSUZ_K00048 [Eucalyptus grandis]|uniref:Uncharacterized protein n=2 Tax=Eucalyptus grandis TaxID=71139 RepID=A0ACC3IQS2_EUCGR|nr:hypothetical protein EUGRSUZ_K00048 [Eucalyptus grandis]